MEACLLLNQIYVSHHRQAASDPLLMLRHTRNSNPYCLQMH
jgi:hypothetical protein